MSEESASRRTVVPGWYVWPNIIRTSSYSLWVWLPVMFPVEM